MADIEVISEQLLATIVVTEDLPSALLTVSEIHVVTSNEIVIEVVEVVDDFQILEVAKQGPPGVPGIRGLQGPSGDTALNGIAGQSLGGHRAVIFSADNALVYADLTNMQHFGRVAGVTLGATIAGDLSACLKSGILIEPSWSWIPEQSIYLGILGTLTQTPPTTGFLQVIGVALTPTIAVINIREPIRTLN